MFRLRTTSTQVWLEHSLLSKSHKKKKKKSYKRQTNASNLTCAFQEIALSFKCEQKAVSMENFLEASYNNALQENQANISFYLNYKETHEKLISNLEAHRNTLEPEILVPICSRVLMKGNLIHTNEVLVSLGSGYFTKCCSTDAQEICKRRINKADEIINNLERERDYLESQMKFREENIFSSNLQEIIEPYEEEKEKEWREEHHLRLKEYRKQENKLLDSVDHQEMMQKLELLELQEDIERLYANQNLKNSEVNYLPLDNLSHFLNNKDTEKQSPKLKNVEKDKESTVKNIAKTEINVEDSKEFILRKKLADLRQRNKSKCTTEEEIFKRLDELEEEEEIEDELDRLYDTIYGNKENVEEQNTSDEQESLVEEEITENSSASSKRVFISKTNPEVQTININFRHSEKDSEIGTTTDKNEITSPTDIYKLFPENFKSPQIKGIIKNCHKVKEEVHRNISTEKIESVSEMESSANVSQIAEIGEVKEHYEVPENATSETQRPVSKFKSMRMANKKK